MRSTCAITDDRWYPSGFDCGVPIYRYTRARARTQHMSTEAIQEGRTEDAMGIQLRT